MEDDVFPSKFSEADNRAIIALQERFIDGEIGVNEYIDRHPRRARREKEKLWNSIFKTLSRIVRKPLGT